MPLFRKTGIVFAALALSGATALGQAPVPNTTAKPKAPGTATAVTPTPAGAPTGVTPPPGYVIGSDDVLLVLFWKDKDLSAEVAVRPDGKISLPLLNDVQASGLTPAELRAAVTTAAARYVEDPNVTVVVKAINSRRVFITGQVARPGPYPLTSPTTVMQLIAMAGGLTEFADSKKIIIMRTENGRPVAYTFNYKQVLSRVNLKQNIELKPGDTVVVP